MSLKYLDNSYKNNVIEEPVKAGGHFLSSDYEAKGTDQNHTGLEYIYNTTPPRPNSQTGEVNNNPETVGNNKKLRNNEKLYSKIYRNPVLNNRENINRKPKDPVNTLQNKEEPVAIKYDGNVDNSNISNSYESNMTTSKLKGYKSLSDLKIKMLYATPYRKGNEPEKNVEVNTTTINENKVDVINPKCKWRPLYGNLFETISKGKYFDKNSDIEKCNKDKMKTNSHINPFKN